jgi:hypothetical protein
MSLDQIGLKYKTDKASNGHNYLSYYEMFFRDYKDKDINLLEIGIWEGSSLKMWAEYFKNGIITGFDIDEKEQYRTERINTFKGDQFNTLDLENVSKKHGEFSIIVDDGSHECHHQIKSFYTLFPLLKSGGLYCIEDLLCGYDQRWSHSANIFDFVKSKIDDVHMNGIISNYEICANKKEQVKKYESDYWQSSIEWVFTSMGLVIIKKM